MQRRLILDALARARHHTTADDIQRQLRAKGFEIDASTIYRNLEVLEGLGHVTHTHLDDRVTRWHRADEERHGHLVCTVCGAETEVPMAALRPLARRLMERYGFAADLAHAAVSGICEQCRVVQSS